MKPIGKKRRAAPFEVGRIYRQASEGSDAIFAHYRIGDENAAWALDEQFETLLGGRSMQVSSPAQWAALRQRAAEAARARAAHLDTRILICTLVDAASKYYSGARDGDPVWLGYALKTAVALAYPNIFAADTSVRTRAQTAMLELIQWAGVLNHINATELLAASLPETTTVTFLADGEEPPELAESAALIRRGFQRGKLQRSTDHVGKLVFGDILTWHLALQAVVQGADPDSLDCIRESVLGGVGRSEAFFFWCSLYHFTRLFLLLPSLRSDFSDDNAGVVVFKEFPVEVPRLPPHERAVMKAALEALFWRPDWHRGAHQERIGNLLVERPIVRATRDVDLMCTSAPILVDGFNFFVENAIFQRGLRDAYLPARIASNRFATTHEQRAVSSLAARGFAAGPVDEHGVWRPVGQEQIKLTSASDCPGEIDVLAVHSLGFSLVLECKVLHIPETAAQMRNLVSKLAPTDTESFHAKLRKKVAWVAQLNSGTVSRRFGPPTGIIILDREMPGQSYDPSDGAAPVIELALLEETIDMTLTLAKRGELDKLLAELALIERRSAARRRKAKADDIVA